MPGGDGTGPLGQGPRTGGAMGRRAGMGQGRARGIGRGGGLAQGGWGQPTKCKCPVCGTEVPKSRMLPCNQTQCPKCGVPMVRGD
ncbi:hypothetical protein DRJ17_05205 [Candidatus Woesearchaeota archaeon]|mgnify:CR=1 FL=1|nr:MAG: hypothetical protein DRJ17_05205 [Candidatus Woesearchaeota archaeon]